MIKQDIVHQVIERTGLPRTKAEAAVDTVFEGLKQDLRPASGSNCAALACSACARAKPASAAIRGRARRSASRRGRLSASNRARICTHWTATPPARSEPGWVQSQLSGACAGSCGRKRWSLRLQRTVLKRFDEAARCADPAAYMSRCASTSTTTLRRGTFAASTCASIPRSAAFSSLREAAFRMR